MAQQMMDPLLPVSVGHQVSSGAGGNADDAPDNVVSQDFVHHPRHTQHSFAETDDEDVPVHLVLATLHCQSTCAGVVLQHLSGIAKETKMYDVFRGHTFVPHATLVKIYTYIFCVIVAVQYLLDLE